MHLRKMICYVRVESGEFEARVGGVCTGCVTRRADWEERAHRFLRLFQIFIFFPTGRVRGKRREEERARRIGVRRSDERGRRPSGRVSTRRRMCGVESAVARTLPPPPRGVLLKSKSRGKAGTRCASVWRKFGQNSVFARCCGSQIRAPGIWATRPKAMADRMAAATRLRIVCHAIWRWRASYGAGDGARFDVYKRIEMQHFTRGQERPGWKCYRRMAK